MRAELSGLVICGMAVGLFFVCETFRAEEQCMKDTWAAFGRDNYPDAIKHADQCIESFRAAVDKEQERLTRSGEPEPPVGTVSESEYKKIVARGLLNDVAAAFFVKAQSAEKLYRTNKANSVEYRRIAEESYKATCQYAYGRAWDPKGWFWSPCSAAKEHLPLN